MATIIHTDDEKKFFSISHDTLISEELYKIFMKYKIAMRRVDGYKDLYIIIHTDHPKIELIPNSEVEFDVNTHKILNEVRKFIKNPRYNQSVCIHPITDPSNPAYSPNLNEYGLFATEDIKEKTVIGLYTGIVCTNDEKCLMEVKYKDIPKYVFMVENSEEKIGQEIYIDGYKLKCEGACINDCRIDEKRSRTQNVSFVSGYENNIIPFIAIIAIEDIKKGEEILGNYGQEYWDNLTASNEIDTTKLYEERKRRFEEKLREIDIQRSKKLEADLTMRKIATELSEHSKTNNYLKEICELTGSKDKSVHLEMKAIRVVEGDDKYIDCPYLTGHTIQKKDIKNHLARCPDRFNSPIKYDVCPFNNDHIMDVKELSEHIGICPNNPQNIQNSKRRRVVQNNEKNDGIKKEKEEEEPLNIPNVIRNLSPSKPMFNSKNQLNEKRGGMKEIRIDLGVTEEISPEKKIDSMIDSLYGFLTEWEIILTKIEKINDIKLETTYKPNESKLVTYVLKVLHRIYDNRDFINSNYKSIPTDIIHGIIKFEATILSDKKNIFDAMHFVSNVFLVDRGLQQLNSQISDS